MLNGCAKKKSEIQQGSTSTKLGTGLIIPSSYIRTQKDEQQDATIHELADVVVPGHEYTQQELFKQYEARSVDIYFPLSYVPKRFEQKDQYVYIEGIISKDIQEIIRVCQQEMERFGWYMHVSIAADPALFIFNKPNRVCVYRVVQEPSSWFSSQKTTLLHIWIYIVPET